MVQKSLLIENIPSTLWGPVSDKLLLAVHGKGSSKADFEIPAKIAAEKGYQVLSFDLPEHGDRKEEPRLCDAQNCKEDLERVMKYARTLSDNILVYSGAASALISVCWLIKMSQFRKHCFCPQLLT